MFFRKKNCIIVKSFLSLLPLHAKIRWRKVKKYSGKQTGVRLHTSNLNTMNKKKHKTIAKGVAISVLHFFLFLVVPLLCLYKVFLDACYFQCNLLHILPSLPLFIISIWRLEKFKFPWLSACHNSFRLAGAGSREYSLFVYGELMQVPKRVKNKV